jgi:hypothetical protein
MYGVGAAWGPYGRDLLGPLVDVVIDAPVDLLALL